GRPASFTDADNLWRADQRGNPAERPPAGRPYPAGRRTALSARGREADRRQPEGHPQGDGGDDPALDPHALVPASEGVEVLAPLLRAGRHPARTGAGDRHGGHRGAAAATQVGTKKPATVMTVAGFLFRVQQRSKPWHLRPTRPAAPDGDGEALPRPGTCSRRGSRDDDRKSTRLNSSHVKISYAVFCLKKQTSRRH